MALAAVGLVDNYGIQKTSDSLDRLGNNHLQSVIGLGITKEGQTAIRLANRDTLFYQNDYNAQDKFADILKNKQQIWERIRNALKLFSICRCARAACAKTFTSANEQM